MKRRKWLLVLLVLFSLIAIVGIKYRTHIPVGSDTIQRLRGRYTVADRQAQYGASARANWQPYFRRENFAYPPNKLTLVAFKKEKQLEVYATDARRNRSYLRTLPVQRLSGRLGPKLRYGDMQVPEGFYRVESLNPNSRFHLALRLNYPNEEDRAQAVKDGRTNLGGDIMIHGSNVSVGCLAMGDKAIEDLFILAADTGIENIEVLICPVDFRFKTEFNSPGAKHTRYLRSLYNRLETAVRELPPLHY